MPFWVSDRRRKGLDVNCLDQLRHTPITTATTGASLENFTILLLRGAKINVKCERGMTLIRRIRKRIAGFSLKGGSAYRRIYRGMAKMVAEQEHVN